MNFASIPELLEEIRAGRMVVAFTTRSKSSGS